MTQLLFSFTYLSAFTNGTKSFTCSENKCQTPDSGESDYRVNYTADKSIHTAADPSNKVELEKTYATPVKRAYYGYYQRYSVQ